MDSIFSMTGTGTWPFMDYIPLFHSLLFSPETLPFVLFEIANAHDLRYVQGLSEPADLPLITFWLRSCACDGLFPHRNLTELFRPLQLKRA